MFSAVTTVSAAPVGGGAVAALAALPAMWATQFGTRPAAATEGDAPRMLRALLSLGAGFHTYTAIRAAMQLSPATDRHHEVTLYAGAALFAAGYTVPAGYESGHPEGGCYFLTPAQAAPLMFPGAGVVLYWCTSLGGYWRAEVTRCGVCDSVTNTCPWAALRTLVQQRQKWQQWLASTEPADPGLPF